MLGQPASFPTAIPAEPATAVARMSASGVGAAVAARIRALDRDRVDSHVHHGPDPI
jgi:hypothetical protein